MKAIALISGGLDSLLAAKLIKNQGIEVIGVHFKIPFALRDKAKSADASQKLPQLAGIELKTIPLGEEFLDMVKHPKHGRGANINPCIDCKILMFKKAKEMMQNLGASFLITGEVLGQRPMSQNLRTLNLIEKEADVEGLVLRPLSAKLLDETVPEKQGWVKREKLFDFSGRSRLGQIELAATLGINDYAQPAGGCLLTDPQFSKRLKDLIEHGPYDLDNVELLKFGRHFRFSPEAKLVVGRNEEENAEIEKLAQNGDWLFLPPQDTAGPSALGRGKFSDERIKLCAGITCRYCDLAGKPSLEICYRKLPEKESQTLTVAPVPDEESLKYRL
jgi:tRNA U34 2-thiouridine synthase MnmA/TrmU